jgi:ligand-binding sensor domain-containing protein
MNLKRMKLTMRNNRKVNRPVFSIALKILTGIMIIIVNDSCERTEYELFDPKSAGIWTTFDITSGLPGNTVTDILLDSQGHLWMTFQGQGIAEYKDGIWINYRTTDGLLNNVVTCLDQSEDGSIIFGTVSGLSTFSLTNIWDSYPSAEMMVTAVRVASDGTIWVGTANNGFYFNRGEGYVNYYTEIYKTINVIEEDISGNIWIGTDNGLIKYDGSDYSQLDITDGLPDNTITAIFQDKRERLWIGTNGGKTVCWIDKSGVHQLSLLNGKDENHINDIFQDRRGHIWFATAADGLISYDGIIPVTYKATINTLPENSILSIGEDKWGNLWFGLASKGVVKYTLPIN